MMMHPYLGLFTFCLVCPIAVLPSGVEVISGTASFVFFGSEGCIEQTSDKAILHWQDFSIQNGETLRFFQPSSQSAVLNRVVGLFPSRIDGTLLANGRVYLINPQGVIIGETGIVRTGGFLATTLQMADDEFLAQSTIQLSGESEERIVQLGTITALEGDVALIAKEVLQGGKVQAKDGTVVLAGASEAVLALQGKRRCYIKPGSSGSVVQSGSIESLRSEIRAAGGSAYSLAINSSGIVEAADSIVLTAERGTLQNTGSLIAKDVSVLGEEIWLIEKSAIDASGSHGGGFVSIGDSVRTVLVAAGPESSIRANALVAGDGGVVEVWGNKGNMFYGTVEAKGGSIGGDGGFVEISSLEGLVYRGRVDTTAPSGKTGTLLLDPSNITISTAASSPAFPTSPGNYNPTGASATLNNTDLQTGLGSSNVTVSTSGGTGGTGTIAWSAGASISWSAATTLTLISNQAMTLDSNITNTGTGSFTAMSFTANSAGLTGTFIGISVGAGVTLSSTDGAISLNGTGGNTGSSNIGVQMAAGSVIQSTGAGAITIVGNGGGTTTSGSGNYGINIIQAQVTSVNGAISITGQSNAISTGTGRNNNYGVYINSGGSVSSTGTATIALSGTGAPADATNTGIVIDGTGSLVSSVSGTVTVTGTGGAATAANNSGIVISNAGGISSGAGAAAITVTGTGTAGTTGNLGIEVTGTGSAITTVDGALSITGVGGNGTSGNIGVEIDTAGTISSTGTGSITINGTGGNGTSANVGIQIANANSTVTSTNGSIAMTGTGQGSTTTNRGIFMSAGGSTATFISYGGSAAGSVTLIGTGSGTSGDGIQISASGGLIASTSSPKSVTFTGTGAGAGGTGILISDSVGGANATGNFTFETDSFNPASSTIQTTGAILIEPLTPSVSIGLAGGAGTLSLSTAQLNTIQAGASSVTIGRSNGTSTLTVNSYTFSYPTILRDSDLATGASGTITAGAFDMTFIADTMAINTSVTGTGAMTIKPFTTTTSIGLGNGATGTLNLDSTELGRLTSFSLITFGEATDTGTVDMQANTYTTPITVYGSTIGVNGAVAAGANNVTFNIGPAAAGTLNLNANVTTSGTFQVNGGANDDAFNIGVTTAQTATLNGMGGTNTLTGPNAANTWAITSANAGTLNTTIAFSNMQNLVGGTSSDNFVFSNGASVSGTINGTGSANNSFDYSAYTTDVSVNLQTGAATGTGGFSNIQSFTGGSGSNTLTGANTANTWNLTANNAGNINGTTTFSSFQNLVGGTSADDFVFSDGVSVSGTIDGTGGAGNSFDYSAYTTDISVNLQTSAATGTGGFSNIQTFTGGTGTNTITGADTENTWVITAANGGTINGAISFNSFANLTGGSGNDTFDFTAGFTVSGTVDGGGGSNTLEGPNAANNWVITATDQGTVGGITFTSIGSLVGGTSADMFLFFDQIGLTGSIDGGGTASQNTLNYTLFTTPATIHLITTTSGTASNLGAGFTDIGNFIGNVTVIQPPTPPRVFSLADIQFYSTVIGVALRNVDYYIPFYVPISIRYELYSYLNGVLCLPLSGRVQDKCFDSLKAIEN